MQGMNEDLARDIESYTCGEIPPQMEMLSAPRIDDWEADTRRRGKEFIMVISGLVRGQGLVTTSPVAWFDRKMRFVRTRNRVYTLGHPVGYEIPIHGVDA